jgi:hypothetical protein
VAVVRFAESGIDHAGENLLDENLVSGKIVKRSGNTARAAAGTCSLQQADVLTQ